jgi:hypothetical protein
LPVAGVISRTTFAGGSESQILPFPAASQSPDRENLTAPALSISVGPAAEATLATRTARLKRERLNRDRIAHEYPVALSRLQLRRWAAGLAMDRDPVCAECGRKPRPDENPADEWRAGP